MSHHVPGLPWTDEQWTEVNKVVQDAARRARVASSFLPLVGPLPPGQASIPALTMGEPGPPAAVDTPAGRLEISDGDTLNLVAIQCNVFLTTQQAEDPELASAKQMLGRGADVVGRLEDFIIFNGEQARGAAPPAWLQLPGIYSVSGGRNRAGLLDPNRPFRQVARTRGAINPNSLVRQVVGAVNDVEAQGYYGPFACVLGHELYEAANTPVAASMVLPSDRIVPFLEGGPLRRSSLVPDDQGVVVALAGSAIDLVVASDVHVKFLQVSPDPFYILRVSERFVLRIKQPDAIRRLQG
jgi:uncharacterized linocin/CFP29 family protein